MVDALLSPKVAALRLGITVATLYDWLGQSDWGRLVIRGQPVTIAYFQGGARGQGRIRIEANEVARLRDLMRVVPRQSITKPAKIRREGYPGIRVRLGRPAP